MRAGSLLPCGPVLVTGGSGRLAGRVIECLLAGGTDHVITTTRSPGQLAALARRGVEVRHADHDDPASLREAYRGARRMLIVSSFSIGSRAKQIANVVEAAQAAGVEHVCYTSATSARPTPDKTTADHFWSELAIMQSAMSWTILRHNMYAEHIPLSLAVGAATGTFHSPIGDQGRGYVTRDDCARADAAALASTSRGCSIVDVTGPAIVGHAELAGIASRLLGRRIEFCPTDKQGAIRAWSEHGIPQYIADLLADFDLFAAEGHHAIATSAVRDMSGQEPESVASYLSRNVDLLRPGATGRADIEKLTRL